MPFNSIHLVIAHLHCAIRANFVARYIPTIVIFINMPTSCHNVILINRFNVLQIWLRFKKRNFFQNGPMTGEISRNL